MRIKEVSNTSQNKKLFRQLSRDTCGETFEPPCDEKLVFCYVTDRGGREQLVGGGSYRLADKDCSQDAARFDDRYCHLVSYLFVKGYDQRRGVGRAVLRQMLTAMMMYARRPVRVESASGATGFFIKQGFIKQGEPIDCVCSGSPMFSTLVRMEWTPNKPK